MYPISFTVECVTNALGVSDSMRVIPNAQISGHLTYSTYNPWDGRLGSSTGWVGNGTGSWLQVKTATFYHWYITETFGL